MFVLIAVAQTLLGLGDQEAWNEAALTLGRPLLELMTCPSDPSSLKFALSTAVHLGALSVLFIVWTRGISCLQQIARQVVLFRETGSQNLIRF